MSYYNQLHPWCIVRCLPNAQTLMLKGCRRRGEAEEYLKRLRRLEPEGTFDLVFDAGDDTPIAMLFTLPNQLSG